MTGVLPWRSEVSMSGRLCAEVSSSICFQPSVRELFVPTLWLPRRCAFDGFLQEFEGFQGYVRPLSGRLLAVSKACLGTSSAATNE